MLPVKAATVRIGVFGANRFVPHVRRCAFGPDGRYEEGYISPINGAPRLLSPWNRWFPYELVPCSPKLGPHIAQVQAGEVYHWCSCGECATQPWCADDGGPHGCRSQGFRAVVFVPQHDKTQMFCGCKQCGSAPKFNGSCWVKWADYNILPACGLVFASSFVIGVLTTALLAP